MPVSYPKAETPYGLKRPTQGFCFRQSATQVTASHRELWNVRFESKPEMPPLARHFRSIPQSRHREAACLNEPGSTAQGFPSSNALLAASPCQLASRTGPQNVEPRSHFANRPMRSHCRNQLIRCTIVFVAKGNSPTYGMNEPRPWKKSLLR